MQHDWSLDKAKTFTKHHYSSLSTQLVARGYPALPINVIQCGTSPYPIWLSAAGSLLGAVLCLQRPLPGWPGYLPSVLTSLALSGSGYAVLKDTENGPSIATAWGSAYTVLFFKNAFKSLKPGPILLSSWILGSTLLYARETIDNFL